MSAETLGASAVDPSKTNVVHLFSRSALQFAQEVGLDVKAFCGEWEKAGTASTPVRTWDEVVRESARCRRCAAVFLRTRL